MEITGFAFQIQVIYKKRPSSGRGGRTFLIPALGGE